MWTKIKYLQKFANNSFDLRYHFNKLVMEKIPCGFCFKFMYVYVYRHFYVKI